MIKIRKQLCWLLSVSNTTMLTYKSVQALLALYTKISRTRGQRFAVSYIKSIRLIVTRYMTRHPFKKYPGVKLSRGLPTNLPKEMRQVLEQQQTDLFKWVLTLLSFTRCFTLPPIEDYKAITDPWTGSFPTELREHITKWRAPKVKLAEKWEEAHWTTKAGPTGPAIAEALILKNFLPEELKTDLFLLGGEVFTKYFKVIDEAYPEGDPDNQHSRKTIRKISLIRDKEGKTRIIAIFDWWSQTVLRMYHETLISILAKIPGDFTYQGDFNKHLSEGQGPYFSFDLSSATDRFPVEVQRAVMENIWGKEKSEAWVRVMTAWEFETPSGKAKWNTGQPIGAYSSWAAFALTHHLVLQVACSGDDTSRYAVLGDDVVIRGHSAAMKYKRLIEELGVPLSEAKTHVSRDTYEFAKRWFRDGVEITPFPLHSLNSSGTRFVDLAQTFRTAESHGWLGVFTTPGLIASYNRKVIGMKRRHALYVEGKTILFMKYIDISSGKLWEVLTSKAHVLEAFLTPKALEKFSNISLIERVLSIKEVFSHLGVTVSERVLQQMEETIIRYHHEAKARVAAKRTVYIPPVGRACGDLSKKLREICFNFYNEANLPNSVDASLNNVEEALAVGKILKSVPLAKVPVGDDGRIRKSVLMLRAKAEGIHIFIDLLKKWGDESLPPVNIITGPKAAQAFSSRLWEAFMKPIRLHSPSHRVN